MAPMARGPEAKTITPINPARQRELRRWRRSAVICRDETLIEKRRKNGDGSDDDQRADAVKLAELREIVEEQFQQCCAQQPERRITRRAGVFPNAGAEQREREQRPADRVSQVPGEIPCELKRQCAA